MVRPGFARKVRPPGSTLDPPGRGRGAKSGRLEGVDTLHNRLRPIKEVQFRFAHFVSHFINVQIFQIDLPLILSAIPSHFIFVGDKMNTSQSTQ